MSRLQEGWITHLRNTSRQDKGKATTGGRTVRCPLCDTDVVADLDEFKNHVVADVSKHESLESETAIEDAFRKITLTSSCVPSPPSKHC